MFLRSLEIKSFRSLDSVKLDHLSNFNVLIGRNNSGRSSVFRAIALLNDTIRGNAVDWETVPTAKDSSRSLEIRLLFDIQQQERENFIQNLWGPGWGSGQEPRQEAARKSSLGRQVEFLFKAPVGIPRLLHLRQTKVLAEDNEWAVIQKMVGNEQENNPVSSWRDIRSEAIGHSQPVNAHLIDIERSGSKAEVRLSPNFVAQPEFAQNQAFFWSLKLLEEHLRKAFFFNPFRHSDPMLLVQQTNQLAQNGSNLAQVLHTINSNDRSLFTRIEKFVQGALPEVGMLQTPLVHNNNTEVGFRSLDGGYSVRLHDMGGGIEQLLMVATVLLTTGDECALFLEEPESHLHAGAQRFLIETLLQGNRQIFITTHSPTFVNLSQSSSIYQFKYSLNRTTIIHLGNTEMLGAMLADIGSRNSDVLLSDAVLFVEGP